MTDPVAATLGVEEEFHCVDPDTLALTSAPRAVAAALAGLVLLPASTHPFGSL